MYDYDVHVLYSTMAMQCNFLLYHTEVQTRCFTGGVPGGMHAMTHVTAWRRAWISQYMISASLCPWTTYSLLPENDNITTNVSRSMWLAPSPTPWQHVPHSKILQIFCLHNDDRFKNYFWRLECDIATQRLTDWHTLRMPPSAHAWWQVTFYPTRCIHQFSPWGESNCN